MRELDLVVWFEKVLPVYPSKGTDDLTLPLFFDKEAAAAVTLIKVNISNLGNNSIGTQEQLWRLAIWDTNASTSNSSATQNPTRKELRQSKSRHPTANTVSLQLGILERRAQVEFWLMAVYDKPSRTSLEVSTSLLGLPKPDKTYGGPAHR